MEYKSAINVEDDELMVKLGFRNPKAPRRDPSIWSKTEAERLERKKIHAKLLGGKGLIPEYSVGTPQKLVLYIKHGDKSVRSVMCFSSDIDSYIKRYTKGDMKVSKYSFAGITYLPFQSPVKLGRNMRVKNLMF